MIFKFGELFQLGENLRAEFRRPDSGDDPVDVAERLRLQTGLLQYAEFIRSANIGDDVAHHFASLAGYLADLDKGITHPVLCAKNVSGAPADRLEVWMIRIVAVEALECFLAAGYGVEQAAKFLSKRYPRLQKLCRSGRDLKGSLISWRKAALSGNISDETAQDAFTANHQAFVKVLSELTSEEMKAFGHDRMKRAVQLAEALRS